MHVCAIAAMRGRIVGKPMASAASSTCNLHYRPIRRGRRFSVKVRRTPPSGNTTLPAQLRMNAVALLQNAKPLGQGHQVVPAAQEVKR